MWEVSNLKIKIYFGEKKKIHFAKVRDCDYRMVTVYRRDRRTRS